MSETKRQSARFSLACCLTAGNTCLADSVEEILEEEELEDDSEDDEEPEEDDSISGSESSDGASEDGDSDSEELEDEDPDDTTVDVTLEFFDPKKADFLGLKALLQSYLDGRAYACSELVDVIIKQVHRQLPC